MFVIVFNRDPTDAREWEIVGPFSSKSIAGKFAKDDYRENHRAWVVIPLMNPLWAYGAAHCPKCGRVILSDAKHIGTGTNHCE